MGRSLSTTRSSALGRGSPKSYESTALGFRMKIHLYYDPAKALRESASLYELLESQNIHH